MNNGVSQNVQEIVNQYYTGVMPSLHDAVWNGHLEVVHHLLAQGANIEERVAISRYTPLHYAARQGHLEVVRELLAQGADSEARNDNGDTPIEIARRDNRRDIVNVLETHVEQLKREATLCGLWRYGLYDEVVAGNAQAERSYDSCIPWLPKEILEDVVPGTALIFSGRREAMESLVAIDSGIEQAFTQERQQRHARAAQASMPVQTLKRPRDSDDQDELRGEPETKRARTEDWYRI